MTIIIIRFSILFTAYVVIFNYVAPPVNINRNCILIFHTLDKNFERVCIILLEWRIEESELSIKCNKRIICIFICAYNIANTWLCLHQIAVYVCDFIWVQ